MKDSKNVKYFFSFGIGLLIALCVLCANSFWNADTTELLRLLADAFIVPAAIVGGVGLLIFASSEGAFSMLTYGFIHFFDLFKPNARNEKYRDYYEYKQATSGKKKPIAHFLVAGIVFFVISAIFTVLWCCFG